MPYSATAMTVAPARARVVEQRRQRGVELGGRAVGLGRVGAEALEVVVEVRQVRHDEVGALLAHDLPGGLDDPARRGDRRRRPPVLEERELAERAGELVVQGGRAHVGVGRLAAVGVVDRPRRDGDVGAGAHRVPPADVRRGEAGSQRVARSPTPSRPARARCAAARGAPRPWSRKYQPLPTMPCWAGARPVSIVDCTLHVTAGSTVPSRAWAPDAARALQARHVRQGARRQADDVEQEYGGHDGTSDACSGRPERGGLAAVAERPARGGPAHLPGDARRRGRRRRPGSTVQV